MGWFAFAGLYLIVSAHTLRCYLEIKAPPSYQTDLVEGALVTLGWPVMMLIDLAGIRR